MESPTFGPRYPARLEMTSRLRNDTFEPPEFIQHPFVHDDNYEKYHLSKKIRHGTNLSIMDSIYIIYIYNIYIYSVVVLYKSSKSYPIKPSPPLSPSENAAAPCSAVLPMPSSSRATRIVTKPWYLQQEGRGTCAYRSDDSNVGNRVTWEVNKKVAKTISVRSWRIISYM